LLFGLGVLYGVKGKGEGSVCVGAGLGAGGGACKGWLLRLEQLITDTPPGRGVVRGWVSRGGEGGMCVVESEKDFAKRGPGEGRGQLCIPSSMQ